MRSPIRRTSRALAGTALLVLAALTATGCVTLPEEKTGTDAAWVPATQESLKQWVERYDKASNFAAARRDPKLISRIEVGLQQSATHAAYIFAERKGENGVEVFHKDPAFYLPHFDDYPLWMFVDSVDSQTNRHVLDLAVRAGAGKDWRKLLSVPVDEGVEIPKIALKDGKAQPHELEDLGALLRSPGKVSRAMAALLTMTDPKTPYLGAFTPHVLLQGQVAANAADEKLRQSGAFDYEHTAKALVTRTLKTENDGVLMLVGYQEKKSLTMKPGAEPLQIPEGSPVRTYTGKDSVTKSMEATYIWQIAFELPPKSSGVRTANILGINYTLADAEVH